MARTRHLFCETNAIAIRTLDSDMRRARVGVDWRQRVADLTGVRLTVMV
jgi:hypothetical protein